MTKIRLLPETDLARIAPLPLDQQRRALRALHLGHPPLSYAPVKSSWDDILNVQPPMFGPTDPSPWRKVEARIKSLSRSDLEMDNNVAVASALHDRATRSEWLARRHEIYPLAFSNGIKVQYWLRLVVIADHKLLVPFFDPRRSSMKLSASGRRFAFSAMHERTRAVDPDLAAAQLGILQFDVTPGDGRILHLYTDEGIELFTFAQMDQMVMQTYALWQEVLQEREVEERRRAAGRRGTLL